MIAQFIIYFTLLSPFSYNYPPGWSDKVDQQVIQLMDKKDKVSCLITVKSNLSFQGYNQKWTKEQKGYFVFDKLKSDAASNRALTLAFLTNNKIKYQSYIITNAIQAELNAQQIIDLAHIPEVLNISNNPNIRQVKVTSKPSKPDLKMDPIPEWGIIKIQADSVWKLGIRGEGVVIAGQDTGYEWEHPALKTKYRGWNATFDTVDHNYNWHDAIRAFNPLHDDTSSNANNCGLHSPFPCDDGTHGTHTMGTMVGSDSLNAVGVAPNAKWIGCRNMERSYGTPSTYLECFEWFLAPTNLDNNNPRPDLAPDVINNSWSCPELEGCNMSNWILLETAIQNLKMAGIMVIVSAGNNGNQGCASIFNPPSIFEESFAVGATRSNDTIANFSSRGPVIIDSSFRLKPNISAPGVAVRSTENADGYGVKSGTSMAGPHVAGVVALVISANPSLRGQVEEIEHILESTAVRKIDSTDCFNIMGLDIPNHIYGHGRVNALKAVEMAMGLSNSNVLTQSSLDLELYPNPAFSQLHLRSSQIKKFDKIIIYDLSGKVVSIFKDSLVLDIDNLHAGIYFLNAFANGKFISKKFVKI